MSAQCLSEYGLRDAFESDTMRVPVERLYCGGEKSFEKGGVKYLTGRREK